MKKKKIVAAFTFFEYLFLGEQEAGCAHGQPAKAVPNDSSAARVLRFIKVVRILKILRLLKGFKFME